MKERVATVFSEALPGSDAGVRCQLVVVEGPDAGRAIELGADEVIAGVASDCDLVLSDERVSQHHVAVRLRAGNFRVRDLGSKNGILYQGSSITDATVAPGAGFKIGRTFLRIQPRAEPLDVVPSQARRCGELVGESLAMREVFAVLELAARSDVTVLLEGETGTGKELAARAVHGASGRRGGPFVAVDCGALPEGLLDSELFGHVRGAFTGAEQRRIGAVARADGGTLFLDEIDGMSSAVQARLLRTVEERAIKPVGGDEPQAVDVRIVAASQSDLEACVATGAFRADLYYRLAVVRVTLPPLGRRREDIGAIVAELLRLRGVSAEGVSGDALERLMAADWPGNVRQLRNVVDRALALSPGARCFAELNLTGVSAADADALTIRADLPYAQAREAVVHAFERGYVRDALARNDGNISATARDIALDRKHLRTLLQRHGLRADSEGDD